MSTLEFPARNLRLLDSVETDATRPWLLVHGVRTLFLVSILLVSIAYQVRLGNFINTEIWLPVFSVVLVVFFFNAVYLSRMDQWKRHALWNAFLFSLDTIAVTLLIYFTGTAQFLFLFLYLVNLVLAGLIFETQGTWILTLWTSICFSGLLIFSPEISGQGLYFSLIVNNMAFVAVTYLGRRVRDQLKVVDARLQETQSDLRSLQDFNELIVSNVASGIIVVSRTGFVQYFNRRSSELLGADHFQQLKIQEVIPELNWPWVNLMRNEHQMFERREIRIQRSDSEYKVFEVVATRFFESERRLKGWLLVIDDRTDHKALEDNLRQQEKLAAVGQLAAGIAHEIRNPLASISGSVQLMLGNPQSQDPENLKLMRIVDKEIDRLNGLISEFLEYVRPEPKPNQKVDLNAVIREVLESLQFNPKLRKDVEQTLKLGASSRILGDRDKLKQALLNLTINAYQAMEKSNRPEIRVETFDQADSVVLKMSDNGCGIRPENLARIFEPFHTTKPQGTGLGLAVTHKILQAHDAVVSVESVVGDGTTFTVEFPSDRDVHTEDLIPLKQVSKG
jgi:two-component system sensor histidine kinase PilS (NtrC family)